MRVWSTLDNANLLKLVGFFVEEKDYTTLWVLTDWQPLGDIPTYVKNKNASSTKRLELVSFLIMLPSDLVTAMYYL